MDKISIIMPIYNAENYLEMAINSVLEQTYKNLEIILVNDGSRDDSGNICDKYKEKDNRIKVLHIPNGGVSKARNAGLDIATGQYIMFIDADDFYEKNSCEILYNEIKKRNADYVIGNYIHTDTNGKKWTNPLFDKKIYNNFKLSIKDYKKSFFVMNSVIWNKIFKKDFIDKNKLRFLDGAIAEDAIFSIYSYVNAENAYFINDIVYNYRQIENNSSISTKCSKEYFEKINESYKKIYEIFEDTDEIGFFRYFYARIMPYLLCKIIDSNYLDNHEDKKYVLQIFKWFFELKNKYDVVVINKKLNEIVENIVTEKVEDALSNIKEVKNYRNKLNMNEREKMYAPTEELFKEMSKYDYKYL